MSSLRKMVEGAAKKAVKSKVSGGSTAGRNPEAGKKGARKGKGGGRIERAVRELLR